MGLPWKSGAVTYRLSTAALAVTSYTGTRTRVHALNAPIATSGQLMSQRGPGLALGLVLSLLQTSVVSFSAQLHVVIFPGRPGSEVPGTQTVEPTGINLLIPCTEVGRCFGAKSHTARGGLVILGAGG